jgi:outer membrane protein assembly factor BamB
MLASRPSTFRYTIAFAAMAHVPMRADHNAIVYRPGLLPRWQFDAGARINGGLALSGNTLVFGTFGKQVIAHDIRIAKAIWRAPTDNIVMSTPVVSNDRACWFR